MEQTSKWAVQVGFSEELQIDLILLSWKSVSIRTEVGQCWTPLKIMPQTYVHILFHSGPCSQRCNGKPGEMRNLSSVYQWGVSELTLFSLGCVLMLSLPSCLPVFRLFPVYFWLITVAKIFNGRNTSCLFTYCFLFKTIQPGLLHHFLWTW